jgi:phage terminase large subunit GpA-like protein
VLTRLRQARQEALRPPPKLSLSEWADRHAYLSIETSADAGKFKSFRYQDGMMDAVTDPTVSKITIMKSARVGYALALDTPIPTPSGWTTMGDVQSGDFLFDDTGKPCRVLTKSQVFTDHDCFRLTFCDGTEVVADAGHRWHVESDVSFEHLLGNNNGRRTGRPAPGAVATKSGVLDTETLARIVTTSRGRTSLAVPNCDPIAMPDIELPIPPYTMGLWLGDGFRVTPRILQHRDDVETADFIRAEGVEATVRYIDSRYPNNATIHLGAGDCGTKKSTLAATFRGLGLTKAKHVPAIYMRASTRQRLELLRGLMDSDGTIGKNGRAEFTNTNKLLSEAVYELVVSLGMKAQFAHRPPQRVRCLSQYRVGFRPSPAMNPFRLARKAARVIEYVKPTINNRRRIVSIARVDPVAVQCVEVDSPSSLFLCSKAMVPTHNTKLLDHVVGYYIHQDPAPILIVQPTESDAEDYSRTEIAPMLRDTPVLAGIAGDLKSKNANQRVDKRVFRNGSSVAFVGANSPAGFRRITARIIAFDEVDGYPSAGAGNEGDQIALGTKRSETFWNRKIILGSTPTVQGVSRIEKSFEESDQRRYHVSCPSCGHRQTLKWENLRWDKTEDGEHLPKTAHFRCESDLGCRIEEHDKLGMVNGGEWIATKTSEGHAGFHIWAAYSLFPNAAWEHLVAEWLRVYRDPVQKKTFVNLVLGETFREVVNITDPDALKARCEPYNYETMPSDVRLITFGADTQDDRIEVTFVGWGAHGESWVARHEVIPGDTSKPAVWNEFDALIAGPCGTDDGRVLYAQAGCIDSAGHRSEMVYKFCRDRKRRRIYATIGRGNASPTAPRMIWPKTASRTKNSGDKPYTVGVDTAKDDISARLAILPHAELPTPRAVHFPLDGLSADYFEQLTSEQAVAIMVGGKPHRKWAKKTVGARNEAWDCLVLALAARMSLPIKLDKPPGRLKPKAAATPAPDGDTPSVPPADTPATPANDNADPAPAKRKRERFAAYR